VADNERTLPLFPLNTVLFPGLLLPLHIFEERYKLMIGACLVTDRVFGVSLIRSGQEVGEPAEPFEVGTFARIVDVERLPDGRMNLVAIGVQRYRLLKILEQKPFLVGQVEPFPRVVEPIESGLSSTLGERFREYVRELRAGDAAGEPPQLSDDPEILSFQLAGGLGISARARQELLELESTAERLRRLLVIVQRERETLRLLGRGSSGKNVGRFSLN